MLRMWDNSSEIRTTQAMSEEQLSALLAKLKNDVGLQEKIKGAADLDAALAIAKEAGLDLSKVDWVEFQAQKQNELSDEELEAVSGGSLIITVGITYVGWIFKACKP